MFLAIVFCHYLLLYEIASYKLLHRIRLCGFYSEIALCRLGLHYVNSIVELLCEIILWDYGIALRNLHYVDSIFPILTYIIIQILLCDSHSVHFILLYYAYSILHIPSYTFYYTYSILFYHTDCIMQIPWCRFYHADSVIQILLRIFYCAYSIVHIILCIFHYVYPLIHILCAFHHGILL